MSREFRPVVTPVARWSDTGQVSVDIPIAACHVPAFIAWLQEGPPRKRWRFRAGIQFDTGMPTAIQFNRDTWLDVDPDDIEEVWE